MFSNDELMKEKDRKTRSKLNRLNGRSWNLLFPVALMKTIESCNLIFNFRPNKLFRS